MLPKAWEFHPSLGHMASCTVLGTQWKLPAGWRASHAPPCPTRSQLQEGLGCGHPPRGSDSAFACPTWSQRSQTSSTTKPFGRGFIDPESSRRLRALEATSEVVAGMRSRRCPGWPHGKRGHGRDTNGNLWGRPLCRWRDKRRMERG